MESTLRFPLCIQQKFDQKNLNDVIHIIEIDFHSTQNMIISKHKTRITTKYKIQLEKWYFCTINARQYGFLY